MDPVQEEEEQLDCKVTIGYMPSLEVCKIKLFKRDYHFLLKMEGWLEINVNRYHLIFI